MSEPLIVFFSSASGNTMRFVSKLPFDTKRIPLYSYEDTITVDKPFILMCPSYGGGAVKGAVPPQVKKFLNVEGNRSLCVGVIASGNTNFGEGYLIAGRVLSSKLKVPFLYGFELSGTEEDVQKVTDGVLAFWENNGLY